MIADPVGTNIESVQVFYKHVKLFAAKHHSLSPVLTLFSPTDAFVQHLSQKDQ